MTEGPLPDWQFILATDLDGTFLGGTSADRLALYEWIEVRRHEVGLIFVTGRDPEFIAEICDKTEVPWPDYVVGDVGTTIASVNRRRDDPAISVIPHLEEEISARWGDAGTTVRDALESAPGLVPQDTVFRYRMSYHLNPDAYQDSSRRMVEAMGHDVIVSDNRFFDVLPKGVSKGPSLLRLIAHLGIDPDRVLVAGDTLNDLSMFETGLKGAVVGGAEKQLVDRVSHLENALLCQRIGAGGIAEAIAEFKLHGDVVRKAIQ